VDAGDYKCHASNKFGKEEALGSLVVKGTFILEIFILLWTNFS
jgi:hypothetical protein